MNGLRENGHQISWYHYLFGLLFDFLDDPSYYMVCWQAEGDFGDIITSFRFAPRKTSGVVWEV
jgi:hypothetical protein